VATGGYVLQLGQIPYLEAWELQRSLAGAVSQGAIPDTIVLLEHPPVVTLGRRTDETAELHVPEGTEVDVVETNRGGKSTYHGPGQLVCYPILDLKRHGRDVKEYVRNLEEALIGTLSPFELEGTRLEGLTGVWLQRPPRKIASIGVHVSRWVTTHGYALNVDLDPAPFTDWITACGLEDAMFTTIARELGRPVEPLAHRDASDACSGCAHRPAPSSAGNSSSSRPNTSSSAATACGRTSSTATGRPVSAAIVVNAASSRPQAVIHSVNGAGSRSTFSAYPCVVTQRETCTPIEAIFRGGRVSQTPVSPSIRSAASSNGATVRISASSRFRTYCFTSRPCRFRSRIG